MLCIQPSIPAYRVPLFSALSSVVDGRLVVVHFGVDASPLGVPYRAIKMERDIWVFPSRLATLRSLIAESDAVIAVFDLHYWDVILATLTCRCRARRLFWGHGLGRRKLGRMVRTLIARASDGIIVYGDKGRRELLNAGLSSQRVILARNTMWVERSRNTSADEKRHFLFVGRLQRRKRLDMLIHAYHLYRRQAALNALDLVIVGDGSQRASLEEQVQRLGLAARVHFAGAITDECVLENIFAGALAYISPGDVGLGVLHAFAYGVPVVTCNVGRHGPEIENLSDEKNGLLVDLCADAIATSLSRLATGRAWAAALGDAAYRHYQDAASPERMLAGFTSALGICDVKQTGR